VTRYVIHECAACRALNASLSARIARLGTRDIPRRSHFLGGRYENLYVTPEALPEIATILDSARLAASLFLARSAETLRVGWWLNVMQPGETTYAHTHDDADELLSGVYYIDVPPNSGRLVMYRGERRVEIEPRAGMFVLFAPDVPHEVTRNDSGRARVSVGFNFGPAEAPVSCAQHGPG
jgi:hypothetical protein